MAQQTTELNNSKQEEDISDKYILDRLIYKDHILKSLIRHYADYLHSDNSDKNQELKSDLLADIADYEFQMAKAARALQTQRQDRENLSLLYESIQKKIKISEKEIDSLKKDYESEEKIKNNRLSYESLASQILEFEDLQSIEKNMNEIMKQIDDVQQLHGQKMKKIKEKEKHLQFLLSTMKELTEDLES